MTKDLLNNKPTFSADCTDGTVKTAPNESNGMGAGVKTPTTLHLAFRTDASGAVLIDKASPEPFKGSVAYTCEDTTYLCSVLADIRAVTGVGGKPMLSELAAAIGARMGQGDCADLVALLLKATADIAALCIVMGREDNIAPMTAEYVEAINAHDKDLPAAPEGEGL